MEELRYLEEGPLDEGIPREIHPDTISIGEESGSLTRGSATVSLMDALSGEAPPKNPAESEEDPDSPWWITFMREEGLFDDDDTSTVFAGKTVEDDILSGEKREEEPSAVTSSIDENEDEKFVRMVEDDESAVGDNEDWRAQLWAVARSQWNFEHSDDSPDLIISPTDDEDDDEEENNEKILAFRNKLLLCIDAYITVFGETSPREAAAKSNLRSEALEMSPFVPLAVARNLFYVVLRNIPSEEKQSVRDFAQLAEHITRVLLSPETNIFRTYMVEQRTVEESNQDDSNKKSPTELAGGIEKMESTRAFGEGKRIRTERIQDGRRRQRDVEMLLYGDMFKEEKKVDDATFDDMPAEEIMQSDGPEEEVRIRSGIAKVVREIVNEDDLPGHDCDWTLPFVEEVLLKSLLKDSLANDRLGSFLTSRSGDKKFETSLAYMYAIRYFPHFYIRSWWRNESPGISYVDNGSFGLVMEYYGNAKLIRNRLIALGINNGIMVHVQELEAMIEELTTDREYDTAKVENHLREVYRSMGECLTAVLQENMRSADFLPSKTANGIDWKVTDITDNPSFNIEDDHPQVVSICLEIGRSFHYQGVTLGKREQDRLGKEAGAADAVLRKRNFDDEMTVVEVDAYLEARSAYQGALKVLRRADDAIRHSHQNLGIPTDENGPHPNDLAHLDMEDLRPNHKKAQAVKHINEARVTIELYLSDTLTTLAYCYEAKLSEFQRALKCYNESLTIYSRHVGKDHPTVIHGLQSVGCIYMELRQWKDALRCFTECLGFMERRLPPPIGDGNRGMPPVFHTHQENVEMVSALKSLGIVKMQLGEYDAAFDCVSKAVDQISISIMTSKGSEVAHLQNTPNRQPPADPFVCDALSKMVDILFAKLSSIKRSYSKRRLAMLYTEDTKFDLNGIDGPRLNKLQIERRAIEIARDVVKMRQKLLFKEKAAVSDESNMDLFTTLKAMKKDPGAMNRLKWYQVLDFVDDMTKLGKLYFRRCDYDDALLCWQEALLLLERDSFGTSATEEEEKNLSRALHQSLEACNERRVNTVGEVSYLIGIASCRVGRNENAIDSFEKCLGYLEEKRKIYSKKGDNKQGQRNASDDAWDVLDLDIGYCEHALGLAYFYSNQFTPATSHYREALRLFEAVAARRKSRQTFPGQTSGRILEEPDSAGGAPDRSDPKKAELDVAINSAIASVMLSLGGIYHDQQKMDRARRFLEGAIQIVYSTTHRILALPKESSLDITPVTAFTDISLILSVVRVGDAHRRIGSMSIERRNIDEAKLALETGMRYLESTNLESRITLNVDDEAHLERVNQNEILEMLMNCYQTMMLLFERTRDHSDRGKAGGASWFGFGGSERGSLEEAQQDGGMTREDLLFRVGNIHAKRNHYDAAVRCFLESRHLTEERLGTSDHPIVGNILFNLGNVYKSIYNTQAEKSEQKAKERAIEAYIESLRIAKATSGPESLAAAEVMESLASILMQDEERKKDENSFSDDDGATNFLRDAVAIRNKHRSDMSLPYARSMHFLGVLRLKQCLHSEAASQSFRDDRGLDEAISCLSQALRVRRVLLGDHLDVAASANSLGVALWKRSYSRPAHRKAMLADAFKEISDALYIRQTFLERYDKEEVTGVSSSGVGKGRKAFRRDIDGVKDIGVVAISTVENMYDLAQIYESQRNFEKERTCLGDALVLMENWLVRLSGGDAWRENHSSISTSDQNLWKARIFHSLGASWFEEDDYASASSEFENSLKFRGLDPIEIATPDEVFDNFFRQQPGSSRRKGRTGLSPLESATTMEKLAIAYDKREKREDALRCYAYCLRVYGEHHGTESLKVATILRFVGKVYQDRHDYKRCVRALQRALHVRDSVGEEDYIPRVEDAMVYMQLARSLMALGAYDDVAMEHFKSAVGILEDANHLSKTELSKRRPNLPSNREPNRTYQSGIIDGQNTHQLLLEGYSSILVLLRRHKANTPEDEKEIAGVLHHMGNAQAALGDYEKAIKSLGHVLKFLRASKGPEHLSVADLLFNLGNIYVETGQIDKARECHHECHEVSSQVLGNESIELAENMTCLGNIEFLAGNVPLALEWFDEALRLLRKNDAYEIAMIKCMHRKAVAHDRVGEYQKAIDCFGEVLRLARKVYGIHHTELSNILNSVGNVHRRRGEVRRALRCYEESLRIRIRVGDQLSIANTKNNIGAIFTSMDQISRARRFYAQALRIKTEILGPENLETSRTLYNMGQLYISDKEYEKGLKFFDESLSIFKLQYGESHNEVASCLCSIGTVYDEMSDEEVALSYFKRALNSVKGQQGAKAVRASALHNVGIILTKRNDIDHAVRIFRETLELKVTDSETKDMSDTQYCLANVLRLTGCINESVDLHKAALDTRIHYLGPDHVDVANSMFGLAQALVDNSNHREALEILQECTRIRRCAHGERNDQVADATFLLGIVLREVGNLSDSLVCLKKAHGVKEASCGENSVEIADVTFKIAIVLCEMGRYDEAKIYNNKALQIRNSLGGNDTEVATILENMGIIDQKLGDHKAALERLKTALDIKRATTGEKDQDIGVIIHAMAVSYTELKKYDNAVRLFEDSVKRKKLVYGPKHLEVARTLVDEGKVFEQVGQFERALMCYEEAVDSDCYEDNSWEMGRVFMRMGITHFALGKAEDSWDCLSEATRVFEYVERREKKMGVYAQNSRLRSKRDLYDLIKCYECMLRLSEASPTRYNVDRSLVLPKVAQVLSEIKEFRKAGILYKDAIVLLKSLPGDTRFVIATNLHNLGNCLHHLGEFNEALTCLEDALGLLQDIPGVEGKHVADTYHSLAFVHQARSDMQESLTCYSNALKSRRSDPNTDRAGIVSTLVHMSEVLRILGMYDAAIKSCKDALRLAESKGDSKHLLVARVVECIGSTHRDRFEYDKALRCYRECLKQRQDAVGRNDVLVGRTLHTMGLLYNTRGERERAKESFSEAARILQTHVGLHPMPEGVSTERQRAWIAETVHNFLDLESGENLIEGAEKAVVLASLLDHTGKVEESLICSNTAVKFLDSRLNGDHLLISDLKHHLGTIYFKIKRYEEAIGTLREALHIRRTKLGETHIQTEETLKTLARAYADTGDSEMALFYFKEVMSMRRERGTARMDSESEADLLLRLGKLHLEQHEFSEALGCFKDSLRLQRQAIFVRDEQKLGETLQSMGSALLEIKQFQESRLTLLSALKVLERVREEGPELMRTAFLLGRVNESETTYDKAIAWFDRAFAIMERLGLDDQKMKARITFRVGMVKFGMKNFDEALSLVLEAQELLMAEFGPNHFEYASCVHARGKIQYELKEYSTAKDCFKAALQVRQTYLKQNDPELGESLHCLGSCFAKLDNPQEGDSCLSEALRIRMLNFGENSMEVGETQRMLGQVELDLGKVGAAIEHFQEAIRIGMGAARTNQTIPEEDYDNLLQSFQSVIALAKNGRFPERLGKLYHQQGSLQSMHKQYRSALSSFTEAIQVYKSTHGEDHLNVANALFNVGVCLKETGDTDRAMKCYARALNITRSQLGEDHPEVAETLQQMAEIYRMKGDLKGAIKWCEQALEIRRYSEDLQLATLLSFSGELYMGCDDVDEAEKSFRECVRLRKKILGEEHLDVALALYSLGYIYETSRRDFKRALRCYEEALRIRKCTMEDDDIETARCYLHLGTVHSALQSERKASFCFNRAIILCAELDEPNHAIVEDGIVGQGHALMAQEKYEEALTEYEKARNMRKGRTGAKEESKETADLRLYEANALEKLGRLHDALSRLVSALDMYKVTVGMEDLGTAGALHRLAELHLEMGEENEALASGQQALKIRKSRLGKHNEATGDSYFIIGKTLFVRKDLETAKPCLEAAVEIFRHKRGGSHISVANSMYYLGCIHDYKKEFDEALELFQGALSGRQDALGRDHLLVSDVLFRLGIIHKKREEFELGSDCLSECLRIRTDAKGEDHAIVADTLFELAGTLKDSHLVSGKLDPSQCYVDAIRIYRQSLGETHVKVAKCLARLGDILEAKGDRKKAGNCFEKSVAIFESKLDNDPDMEAVLEMGLEDDYDAYAEALLDWATFLDSTGNDGSAMKTYRRALLLFQNLRGRDDEVIDTTLCKIANVLGRQDRFGEALQLLEQVKKRRIATVGENHPLVGDVLFALGQLFDKKRDYYSAMSALENCLRIRRATMGPFSEEVAFVQKHIGIVQANRADFKAAMRSWDEALAIYKKAGLGDEDEAVLAVKQRQTNAMHMLESLEGV